MRVLLHLGQRAARPCVGAVLAFAMPLGAWADPHTEQNMARVAPGANTPGLALAACPVHPQYPLPSDPAALQGLVVTLDAAAPLCLRNAPFHAWRGAALLAQQSYAAAAEALERALLIDPDLPGAQLDYAEALMSVGDADSAAGLLRQLQARADLPAYLRPLLGNELAALNPQAWQHRWALSSAMALDSNLNNAPAASQLTLTFPQGPVTLPLAEANRPQGGGAWLGSLQWQGIKPVGEQLWLASAEMRTRATAHGATTGYAQGDASVAWLQAPQAPAQWIGRLAASRVDFGGQHLLDGVRVSTLRQWRLGQGVDTVERHAPAFGQLAACRAGLGLEAEQRHYPTSQTLDGTYTGVQATLQCGDATLAGGINRLGWLSQHQWGLQWRAGEDRARQSDRPGGSYRRTELRANWEASAGLARLAAEYSYTRQTDGAGYSPLLASNHARNTRRHGLRLMASHPLPAAAWGGAEVFVAWEANAQSSNIEAFATRQRALSAGLRWQLR